MREERKPSYEEGIKGLECRGGGSKGARKAREGGCVHWLAHVKVKVAASRSFQRIGGCIHWLIHVKERRSIDWLAAA